MSAVVQQPAPVPAGPDTLAHRITGGQPGTVVLVHGFAQTGECFGPLAAALERTHTVVRVDQPGHGGSLRHKDAELFDGARLLVETFGDRTHHGQASAPVLVGYSMGARLCLHAALVAPERVGALVLIGGTAGMADAEERASRRSSDAALAARLEDIGLDAFLVEWLSLPLFAGLPEWARFDEERRRNTVEGLAASLRHAGTGTMEPLWDRLGEIRCPVLCVTGERDQRYGDLAERLVAGFGGPSHHVVVPGVGHAAHLEDPDATIRAIRSFLTGLT